MSYRKLTGFEHDHKEDVTEHFDSHRFAVGTWRHVKDQDIDPKLVQPYLAFRALEVVKKTLEKTTQLGKMIVCYPLRRHVCACFGHLNAKCLEEIVSTATVFANWKSGTYHGWTCCAGSCVWTQILLHQ